MTQSEYYHQITSRNTGLLPDYAQDILSKATVAVAGCGADGGAPAVSLARLGVKHFRLADPDHFDYSNLNRQEGAFLSTRQQSKVEVIASLIRDIHVDAEIATYPEGVTNENIEKFLEGADILLEEIDYHQPYYSLLVHQEARKRAIPVITVVSVGWNAFLFYFAPDGMTYEEYAGIEKTTAELRSAEVDLSAYAPELPPYLSAEMINDILTEKIEIPAIDPAVRMAAALASSFTYFILTKARDVQPVPHYYRSGDLFTKEAQYNAARAQGRGAA